MRYELYEDQLDLVTRVRMAMRRYRSVLMQSATGSGKTQIALNMIEGAQSKGSTAWFLVPRKELMAQTMESMIADGINFGVIAPGHVPNPFALVQIGMTPTVARRLERLRAPKVCFIDECHYGGAELDRIIAWLKAAGTYIVGLSATPLKTNGQGMCEWYDHMEEGLPLGDLIERKRLSDFRYFAPSHVDLSAVKVKGGNYVQTQLESFMEDQDVLIGDAVSSYADNAMGMLNIGFATSRKHAGKCVDKFRDRGIAAMSIDGTMGDDERRRIIQGFAKREFTVLFNVALLTFGFDLAQAAQMDVTVECMSDLNPMKSLPMQMQKWGRTLRKKPYPALIFDHANNWREHDFPDSPRAWSLEGVERRGPRGEQERDVKVRQCEIATGGCGYVFKPAPVCPNCGRVMPVNSREVDEVDGHMAEIDRAAAEAARKGARQEQGRTDTLEGLIALGRNKGYKNPEFWAKRVMAGRKQKHG